MLCGRLGFGHHEGVRFFAARVVAGCAFTVALLSMSDSAVAQVYRWEDPRGTVHFTNALDRIPESYRSQVGPLPGDGSAASVFPGESVPAPAASGDGMPPPVSRDGIPAPASRG